MKIATFQLRSQLGDVQGNIRRADALLDKLEGKLNNEKTGLDLLVLPEMAFSGYNFPSLEAVRPYLEPTEAGSTAQWARLTAKRLDCVVGVGYPEIFVPEKLKEKDDEDLDESERRFNSLLFVNSAGKALANYQKHFLYYTDEPWAHEGESHRKGLFSLPLAMPLATSNGKEISTSTAEKRQEDGRHSGQNPDNETNNDSTAADHILTTAGICMDINPYKFIAPYAACEFATHALTSGAKLIVVSMAWLTTLTAEELAMLKGKPDMDTFQYWIQRFSPFFMNNKDNDERWDGKQIIIVFANRAGEEDGLEGKDTARYAGTSCVVGIRRAGGGEADVDGESDSEGGDSSYAEIVIWEMLGATEEGVCYVDTDSAPKMIGKIKR